MKKIIAMILALAMVLTLAACVNNPAPTDPTESKPQATEPKPTESQPTEPAPTAPTDTKWNAVEGYDKEASDKGVWRYFFFDPTDSSYNPMGGYEERNDGSLCEWYPWEGSWVGIGFNKDAEGALEMNIENKDGMRSVLGFCAPVDGKYVFSGTVANPWEQNFGTITISVGGEAKVNMEINSNVKATYHLDPVEIEMKAGDVAYVECTSTGDWVSAYVNIDVEKDGQAGVYLAPTEGAIDEWSKENADGTWVYAYTADGKEYTVMPEFKEEEWAHGWFSPNGTGLDFQTNPEFGHMIEANVGNNEMTALGYKSPVDGVVTLTIYTKCYSSWGQSGSAVVSLNGEDVATLPLMDNVSECVVELNMKKGEIAYIHGVTEGEWLCTFLSVKAEAEEKDIVDMPEGGAIAEFSKENADGTWVYAVTTDGKTYTVCPKFDTPDWDGDGNPDASQWYSKEADGTGMGINNNVTNLLELNANNGTGEMMALGYKAAEDGTYKFSVYTQAVYGGSKDVIVSHNGEDVDTVPFGPDMQVKEVSVTLKAGEVVYFHGQVDTDWVSYYLNVIVG